MMFSESETDGEYDDAMRAALQTAQIAGGTAASQATGDLKSWVLHMRSLTEPARAKMGMQARPVLVMSMCSGMGTHVAAMKVGQHRLWIRHVCRQAQRPDRFPSRVGSTDRPGRPTRDRQRHCHIDGRHQNSLHTSGGTGQIATRDQLPRMHKTARHRCSCRLWVVISESGGC